MSWWLPHNFENKRHFLDMRACILREIRAFFADKGFVEVETPALQVCPTMDAHIHGFQTDLKRADLQPLKSLYLHTSPEFDMKKLLVAGMPRIFQICHSFRNGENTRLHSPEFTLLEWYRSHTNYEAMMEDCIDLLRRVAKRAGLEHYKHKAAQCDPFSIWKKLSVVQAFSQYACIELESCLNDRARFAIQAAEQGVRVIETDQWDDIFHAVMAAKIEPHLGMYTPCILYDYPASMAALSRRKPSDPRFAERFELYVCGVELANAFSELTDPAEQQARYVAEMATKQALYGETYPLDEEFLSALEYGMPDCAGIALGVDRLIMLATGAEDINQVLWAPVQI